jgi:hypothetical protein
VTKASAAVYTACKVSERLFVIHPRFRRANFYSQQLRALALIEGLVCERKLEPGARQTIVVGAGITGLTAAAALATVGASVIVLEKRSPLAQYRNAPHRELHPNIIMWPFQRPRAMTNLPFLNWCCQTADRVVAHLWEQWQEDFSGKVRIEKQRVLGFEESHTSIHAVCESGAKISADVVVVGTGFLPERTLGTVKSPDYWTQYAKESEAEVFITGSGDGGLIDGAFQIFGNKTVAAARTLAHALQEKPQRADIERVETEALELAERGEMDKAFSVLEAFYGKLQIEPEDLAELAKFESDNRQACIFYQEPSAFSPYVSPANKTLIAALANARPARLKLQRATVVQRPDGTVVAQNGTSAIELDRDNIIVRHGAPHTAYELLHADQVTALDKEADKLPILTRPVEDEFEETIFLNAPVRPIAPSPKHRRKSYYGRIHERLISLMEYLTPGLRGIGIESSSTGDPWTVHISGPTLQHLHKLFPIDLASVKIISIESSEIFEVL